MNQCDSPGDGSLRRWWRGIAASAALLLVVGLLVGCSPGVCHMYLGQERPDSETATVVAGVPGLGILAVDENKTPSRGGNLVPEVRVLPGKHSVLVMRVVPATVGRSGYRTNAELLLDAVAGHRYSIHSERGRAGVSFWIEDETTGRIVTISSPL